jgi:RES domain-containing protein
MAESVSLAVLENLVHMSRQDFPANYVSVAAVLPDDLMIATERELRRRVELRDLSSQSLGDWWLESQESAVLEVASIIVPDEHNYLLNPAHSDFARIATEPPALFHFDPRLFR